MRVHEVMTIHLSECTAETKIADVAKMMLDEDCGAIPVVESKDNPKPVGIITDRDIVIRSVALGKNPLEMKASECMTSEVFTIGEDDQLSDCYDVMINNKVRRVIVLDSNGSVKGIVAQADIAVNAPDADTAGVVERISQPVE